MQFLYIVIAMIVSVGVGTFSGSDAMNRTAKTIDTNRAVAYQEQSKIFARSVRRQVQLNPGSFRNIATQGSHQLTDTQMGEAAFGGYRNHGRFGYIVDATGRIVPQLTTRAQMGPNGLDKLGDVVEEIVLNPQDGRAIGRLNLSKIGVLN